MGRSGQLGKGGQNDSFIFELEPISELSTIPEGPFFQMRGLGPGEVDSDTRMPPEFQISRMQKLASSRKCGWNAQE